jgi:hypothetical protein
MIERKGLFTIRREYRREFDEPKGSYVFAIDYADTKNLADAPTLAAARKLRDLIAQRHNLPFLNVVS